MSAAQTVPTRLASVQVDAARGRELWGAAEAVLESRCMVCHGCYDAPCQLKLDAHEGVLRGAIKEPVYEGSRLVAMEPTRLFVDQTTLGGWRERGFYPVVHEGPEARPEDGVLWRMLELKRAHRLKEGPGVDTSVFDLGINREQVCTKAEDFSDFAEEHPQWGMPYALPALTEDEHRKITDWLRAGAPGPEARPIAQADMREVERWETLLNGDSLKEQLMGRYLYEHLFFASIHFGEGDRYFRMVRSRTPPGEPVAEIATRRPFDDPKSERVFYRLIPRRSTRLHKTHMPYRFDDRRLSLYRELFLDADYDVKALPGYAPDVAANPFKAFGAMPVRSRYRFLLEEAEYTMMGFIKGPVCHGQTALNVIQERFWVVFVDPSVPWLEAEGKFLAQHADALDMPAEGGSTARLSAWLGFARRQRHYLEKKAEFARNALASGAKLSLESIWDGDGNNDNAALTVFRHFDSATVEKGLLGGDPMTAWVVGYALLERIHYLLVAGFDVFGNIGHQLTTRMYMDFLRMEGEHNFLLLLPEKRRRELVDHWYRDVDADVKEEVYGELTRVPHEPNMAYTTDEPEHELFERMQAALKPVNSRAKALSEVEDAEVRAALVRLGAVRGRAASIMPETALLTVQGDDRADGSFPVFTISRDSAHTNVAHLFFEEDRRLPDEDELTVTHGILGSYPNALFSVPKNALGLFVDRVEQLSAEEDYRSLRLLFGVLRNDTRFWKHSDALHRGFRRALPREYGLLDYNRLDAL